MTFEYLFLNVNKGVQFFVNLDVVVQP